MSANRDSSLSIGLVEHDVNGDDLCVWTFPGLSPILQALCIKRTSTEGESTPFIYFKYKSDWVYAYTMPLGKDVVPDVKSASLCIAAKSFQPEKYGLLSKILFDQYSQSGDPTKVLEGFLSVHSVGKFSNKVGSFDNSQFKDGDAMLAVTCFKELLEILGVEFVVLWNAMLLKKRVLVVAETVDSLYPVIRSLPLLSWHRQDFSILRPLVRADDEHLEDLQSAGVFVAGTLDTSLASRSDLYDVLLSLPERRVTVTTHAIPEMKMCSIHRELAAQSQEAAEAGDDLDVFRAISKKTSTVLKQLRSIAPEGTKLTEAMINEQVKNEAAQQWLVRLATAEGLM